jgi:5-methylcytosine-specific restriction enzyme subunit McrC
MSQAITVYEYDCLYRGHEERKLRPHILEALQVFYSSSEREYYKLIHNGIKFNSYVGVLQVGDTVIEVLPKADRGADGTEIEWRKLLIAMLRFTSDVAPDAPSSADLTLQPNSILEHYFEMYLRELEYLIRMGLVKRYRQVEENASALKGSLVFSQHIQQNLVHQERFFVRHDTYDTQHLLHQILYKALRLLKQINTLPKLHQRIGAMLLQFPEMEPVKVTAATFERLRLDRKTAHYAQALDIAKLLLLNFHPDLLQGSNHLLALMFDMNQLWERFVTRVLQEGLPSFQVSDQTSSPFWNADKFSYLRPDILVWDRGGEVVKLVLDAKWKTLDGGNPSPEDLRQVFAYLYHFDCSMGGLLYPGREHPRGDDFLVYRNLTKTGKHCSMVPIGAGFDLEDFKDRILDWVKRRLGLG